MSPKSNTIIASGNIRFKWLYNASHSEAGLFVGNFQSHADFVGIAKVFKGFLGGWSYVICHRFSKECASLEDGINKTNAYFAIDAAPEKRNDRPICKPRPIHLF